MVARRLRVRGEEEKPVIDFRRARRWDVHALIAAAALRVGAEGRHGLAAQFDARGRRKSRRGRLVQSEVLVRIAAR